MTALSAKTGERLWRAGYLAPYTPGEPAAAHGAGPKATPLFHNGRLFTLGISGIVAAFDAGLLRGAPRIFSRLPQGFPILPAPFQFLAVALTCLSSLLGQHAELLGFGAEHFRFHAPVLDAVARRVAGLALGLGCIAPAFRIRAIVLVRRFRHRPFSRLSSG